MKLDKQYHLKGLTSHTCKKVGGRQGGGSVLLPKVDKRRRLEGVLTRILQDRTLDYLEGSRMLTEQGWLQSHRYLCLVFQLTYLDQGELPAASVCRYVEEQYDGCCCFPFREDIVCFFDLSDTGKAPEEIAGELTLFIRESYLKAGFSRAVDGHMNLRRQYVQAKLALDVGSRCFPYQWIDYFDQIAFPYILEQTTRRLPKHMIVHDGLNRLLASDRDHGTEYVKTLRCYLDNHENALKTAKDLYIHRSTFLYRLEKIRDLLGTDFSDPEELLYLMLSFRIMER